MKDLFRNLSAALSIVIVSVFFAPAQAIPIDIAAGESIIFNFDFTSEAPPPPYDSASASWSLTNLFDDGEVDNGLIEVFADLYATGSVINSGEWTDSFFFAGFGDNRPDVVDGLFSMKFTAITGTVTLTSISGLGYPSEGAPVIITPTLVPEPTTLSLLVAGLIGFGLTRRRRRAA